MSTIDPHFDDQGVPCVHHPAAPSDVILALATVGSRASGFNHDIASKLQGLMMALDEISEIAETDPNLSRAAETAHSALKEVLGLLNTNRAMTKTPSRSPIGLADLTARAGERVYVTLRGDLPAVDVEVSAPTMVHALSLVYDIAGGPGRGRSILATTAQSPTHITLSLPIASPMPTNAPESLAIADYVLTRDGGSLSCAGDGTRFLIKLPLSPS